METALKFGSQKHLALAVLVAFKKCSDSCRGFLSAKSLLGAIRGAEDKMSFPLVAKYLLNRMKRCVAAKHSFK